MKRTTVTLDEEKLDEARRVTGISRTSDIIDKGLSELIMANSARRLAALCGSDSGAFAAPRNR
jgi:Arc/MetJ family transcription regulator